MQIIFYAYDIYGDDKAVACNEAKVTRKSLVLPPLPVEPLPYLDVFEREVCSPAGRNRATSSLCGKAIRLRLRAGFLGFARNNTGVPARDGTGVLAREGLKAVRHLWAACCKIPLWPGLRADYDKAGALCGDENILAVEAELYPPVRKYPDAYRALLRAMRA